MTNSISPNKIGGKRSELIFFEPTLKINYGSRDIGYQSPRVMASPNLPKEIPNILGDPPKSMKVNTRGNDRNHETNLLILFNNETMILPSSHNRSKNVSQLDNTSPRKNGNISARNSRKMHSKQRRD
jgi:hypothetical protein